MGEEVHNVPCRECGSNQEIVSVLCGECARRGRAGPDAVTGLRLYVEPMSPMFGNQFAVWIIGREPGTRKRLRCRVQFEEVTGECQEEVEAFRLPMSAVQDMMDRLWSAGVRPSSGDGNEGALKATQNHLKDMREIAFQKLKAPNLVVIDGKIAEVCPREQAGGRLDDSE